MDVIETADIELAAYAIARGGELRLLERAGGIVFQLEGPGIEKAEIDFAHFGPRGIARERIRRLTTLLASVPCGRRA